MPFYQEKGTNGGIEHHHHTRTVINKETTIIEKAVLNASMENLTVRNLSVTNLSVPDPSIFYPPPIEQNLLNASFLDFSTNEAVIALQVNNKPFLTFSPETTTVVVPALNASTATFETLHVGRIETTQGNEIGGVLLNGGTVTAPSNVYVGEHFVARHGAIGGVTFKGGAGAFSNLVSKKIETPELHVESAYITNISCANDVAFLGVSAQRLSVAKDACISGVRIHDCGIFCDFGSIAMLKSGRLEIDNISITSEDESINITGGLFTPESSVNSIGCIHTENNNVSISGSLSVLSADISSLTADILTVNTLHTPGMFLETANIGTLSASTVNSSSLTCSHIVSENTITAKDFRLLDGTSIVNTLLPKGVIMLFCGSVPPRGWLKCDGRGGTPLLAGPSPNVVYIVRV
jgi:hypothetical protein